ncbi:MAG: hypothetical protein AB7N80_06020 [Bdellovibrionales bacterium]
MYIAFAVNFLSALWFANRIWRNQRALHAKCVGFLTILASLLLSNTSLLLAIWFLTLSALSFLVLSGYKNWHHRKFRARVHRQMVENIILEMRAGRSFRSAIIQAAAQIQDETLNERVKLWLAAVPIENESYPNDWWSPFARELSHIDRQAHHALERMLEWRLRLKLESDFRRRFGQVASQIRLQALIVTILYLAILAVNLLRGAWNHAAGLILISALLLVVGFVLIFRLGGRVKWNF